MERWVWWRHKLITHGFRKSMPLRERQFAWLFSLSQVVFDRFHGNTESIATKSVSLSLGFSTINQEWQLYLCAIHMWTQHRTRRTELQTMSREQRDRRVSLPETAKMFMLTMPVLEETANRSLLKVLRPELKGKVRALPRELRFLREATKTLPFKTEIELNPVTIKKKKKILSKNI